MISMIVVSAGESLWETLTVPAVEGLEKHADAPYELIAVDNGGLGRGDVNLDPMRGYAEAVNIAAADASGDRLLILNNDIKVNGPYLSMLGEGRIEGPTILLVDGHEYIEGWAISIGHGLWDQLGGFDAVFHNSWEDVDLSWRAKMLGVKLHQLEDWPVMHLGGMTRAVTPGANDAHEDNSRRFRARRERTSGTH